MSEKAGFCDLGFAKIDTDRPRRKGFSEVIYCPRKTFGHLKKIISALLVMLNSCSPEVIVVNIDNGFGAGYFASLINRCWVLGDR